MTNWVSDFMTNGVSDFECHKWGSRIYDKWGFRFYDKWGFWFWMSQMGFLILNATNGISDFECQKWDFWFWMPEMGFLILNARNGISDFECQKWGFWFWMPQMGFLILNATNGVSDFEYHKWGFWFWMPQRGFWFWMPQMGFLILNATNGVSDFKVSPITVRLKEVDFLWKSRCSAVKHQNNVETNRFVTISDCNHGNWLPKYEQFTPSVLVLKLVQFARCDVLRQTVMSVMIGLYCRTKQTRLGLHSHLRFITRDILRDLFQSIQSQQIIELFSPRNSWSNIIGYTHT